LPAEAAAKQLSVSTRTVETAKTIKRADPVLADEVKQGKTKLAAAATTVAAKKPKSKKEKEAAFQQARAERFEKSAIILEKFCDEYFGTPEWRGIVPAIQGHLHALGKHLVDPPPFGVKEAVKVLIDQYGFEAVSDEVLEHDT
jgi:hypothetical protein